MFWGFACVVSNTMHMKVENNEKTHKVLRQNDRVHVLQVYE